MPANGLRRTSSWSWTRWRIGITTPFDMTVLNQLDRFHLVMDAVDRLPQTGEKGVFLKGQLKDKLFEHKQYINRCGQDMPEIRNWTWGCRK